MLAYDELTPPERELWDAFPAGRWVDLRTGVAEADDPVGGDRWGPERTIRAEVIAALLLGANAAPAGAVASLRLAGARITGGLDLSGAEINHTLWLKWCRLEEKASFYGASTRTIRIVDSRLPGFNGGLVRVEGHLELDRSTVDGAGVSLMNAHLAGELKFNRATIRVPGHRWAVFAGGLVMGGGVFGKGLTTEGGLRLLGAQLSGGLNLRGARLGDTDGLSLRADNVTVTTMRCSDGFTTTGTVRLRSAQVSDWLSFEGARLGGDGAALVGIGMRVEDLNLRFAAPPAGSLDLRSSQVTWVQDDDATWPDEIRLDGLTYGSVRFAEATASPRHDLARRLAWVRRSPGYSPQPYEQLAAYYRQIGHDDEARRVLLAKQRHRRRTLGPAGRVWGRLLDATVGYGYRPWLAGVWLLALTLLGTLVFHAGSPTPNKPGEGPPFNAFVYTLDLLVPIGGLGQRGAWHWTGDGRQVLAYAMVAVGWMLTTAVVAGVTRTLSRS
ncbi:oxidoreductase [Streptomyces sp. XD-27]|uniref:oxidoreductase n=1 Tax=Streptomyces sp. XD-27 TaxID=3062779 RepID=UPI0026F4268B|nr:oxidoreductase [Streptomyces sp. XD-27]WKX71117.1 oxidoreductase [Streptomyces sp. XD-27]